MKIIVHYTDHEIEVYDGYYELSPDYVEIRSVTGENSGPGEYSDIVIPIAQVRKVEVMYGG